ncbi:MAG TPA: tetratricopeptide repeat protein, partial [Sphingomonas sp.]|nr:tetratricopeptide repeat protein [Sphingomonas sp.]
LTRMNARPYGDLTDRKADVDKAMAIDPKHPEALAAKARLQRRAGDYVGALATLKTALQAKPADTDLLVEQGLDHALLGKGDLADKDYAAARGNHPTSVLLNNLCWAKATANASLPSALEDCRAAVAEQPKQANYIDSLGFVLLRLGRYDESIAAYDRALAIQPKLAPSLYGRAAAEARKGDAAKAAADRAAAIRLAPKIADTFQGYGVAMDEPAPAAPAANPAKESASAAQH